MSSTFTERGPDEGLVDQATAKVQDAASAAHEKADELTSKGRSRLSQQLDQRTTDAGSQARSLADALRSSTEQLRTEGNSKVAGVAEQAADQVERVGSYLEQKGGDEILRDVESFARRRPWMIAGLGLLGGIAASRFVKASSERRFGNTAGSYATPGYRPAYETPGGVTPVRFEG